MIFVSAMRNRCVAYLRVGFKHRGPGGFAEGTGVVNVWALFLQSHVPLCVSLGILNILRV